MNLKKILLFLLVPGLIAGCQREPLEKPVPEKPVNVMLILADDLAYTDLSTYGSEIQTPNIDNLAAEGFQFNHFHTAAMCSPSRAMLLTGVDQHKNGYGTMAEFLATEQRGKPGYEGYLNDDVVTVASVLQQHDFHTYMTGKWHLGAQSLPSTRGFDETYILVQGAGSHFNNTGYASTQPTVDYRRNGDPVTLPDDFYSSDFYTDQMIEFIDTHKDDDKPFFGYLAFSAPHWPLHAPEESIEKYADRYDAGWDVIRKERHDKLKELGLIGKDAVMAPRLARIPAWDEVSAEEQRYQAKEMAVFAAMVDRLDENVGKLVNYLKSIDEYDNTVFIFLSDNGPEAVDFTTFPIFPPATNWIRENFDNSYENLGLEGSYQFYGGHWAHVGATAHRLHKTIVTQGGIQSPLIISAPKILRKQQRVNEFASVLDITPTILDLANVEPPKGTFRHKAVHEMDGRSMLPFLRGDEPGIYGESEGVGFELFGHNAFISGHWKVLRLQAPYGDGTWGLYDLSKDPAELNDLGQQEPERLATMVAQYEAYVQSNGVIQVPDGWTMFGSIPLEITNPE
jgi:arylsulfatase A-like enzyme